MTPEERGQMNALCTRLQEEKDYARFVALLRELNYLFARKERRLGHHSENREWQRGRPWRTVAGLVTKVVKSVHPTEPEKVEISIEAADELFREIRIENRLTNMAGEAVRLKEGARLDVTFEAETKENVEAKVTDSLS
jgi:hypothetical protein